MKQAANLNFEIGIYLPGTQDQDQPDRFRAARAVADDALQGRELGVVRTAHVGREGAEQGTSRHRSLREDRGSACPHFAALLRRRRILGRRRFGFLLLILGRLLRAACRSSTIFCKAATVAFRPSICALGGIELLLMVGGEFCRSSFAGNRHCSAGNWSAAPWSFRRCRSRCREHPARVARPTSACTAPRPRRRRSDPADHWISSFRRRSPRSICRERTADAKDITRKPHSRVEVIVNERGQGCGTREVCGSS